MMDTQVQSYQLEQHSNVIVASSRPPKDGKSKKYHGRQRVRQMTHGDVDGKT